MKDMKRMKVMKKDMTVFFMSFTPFMTFIPQNRTRMPAVNGIAQRALESLMVSRPDPIS